MRTATVVGIALILLGVLALGYEAITFTTEEKVLDIGPLKASVEKERTIPLPPVLGGVAMIGGLVVLIAGARTR